MKKALIAIVLLLFSLTVSTSALNFSHAQETNPNFSDHFDGTTIDPTKWTVQENTNMSGYAAYGGSIIVSNSAVNLASSGSSFPCVVSSFNPLPSSSDFAIEFDITFTRFAGCGDGFWISSGSPFRNAGNLPDDGVFKDCVFAVWGGTNQAIQGSGPVCTTLLGQQLKTPLLTSSNSENIWYPWDPYGEISNANTYKFELSYSEGTYTVFLNGTVVASAVSTVRPDTIGFGHPPCAWVPLNGTQSWTSFKIGSIRMLQSTSINLSTNAASTQLGFSVDVNGTLTSGKGEPMPAANVVLSYLIPGVPAWNTFTSTTTNTAGAFAATWLPTATGNFIIKAEYNGDETHSGSTDTKNISVVRGTKQSLLYAESNSTLSSLSLNSTSNEISFTVSGPSGTTGYVKFLISKELLSNVTDLKVYIDGQQAEYTVASVGDLQSLFFSYGHSTHAITIKLPETAAVPEFPAWLLLPLLIASTLFAVAFGKKQKLHF